MLNLILYGPPGAGKGTQSLKVVERFNLKHLSTGDMLRAQIKNKTDLGLQAKVLMDQGELVPDDVVIGMINSELENAGNSEGFIFDGFPRTTAQAEALDNLLESKGWSISSVLSLKVDDKELTNRLLERGKTSGRPDDRNKEIIENRIAEYGKKTKPVADYYKLQEKFTDIDGLGDIDEIFERLAGAITALA